MTTAQQTQRPTSAELDAADPLAAQREAFYTPDAGQLTSYLTATLGRPFEGNCRQPAVVCPDARSRLIRGWDEQWMDEPTRVGDRIGEVTLGAAPGQVTVGDSTSVMLYKLIRAAVDAQPGRDEIIIDRDNFPTDRFIIEGIAKERGASIKWIAANPPVASVPLTSTGSLASGPPSWSSAMWLIAPGSRRREGNHRQGTCCRCPHALGPVPFRRFRAAGP